MANRDLNVFNDEQLITSYLMIKAGLVDDPNGLNDDVLHLIKDSLGDDHIDEMLQDKKQVVHIIKQALWYRKARGGMYG